MLNKIEEGIEIVLNYKAKNPSGTGVFVSMPLIITHQIISMFMIGFDRNDSFDNIILWARVIIISLCLVFLILTIIRMNKKLFTIHISPDSLRIGNRELTTEEIKEIRIQGYFKPLVGITPIGKRFTPIDLCFRFMANQEDEAIKQLTEWAKGHNIKVAMYKNVKRWL